MPDPNERHGDTGLALQVAYGLYQHGESIAQARMHTYLFTMTLLLLCWATAYSSEYKSGIVVMAFSLAAYLMRVATVSVLPDRGLVVRFTNPRSI